MYTINSFRDSSINSDRLLRLVSKNSLYTWWHKWSQIHHNKLIDLPLMMNVNLKHCQVDNEHAWIWRKKERTVSSKLFLEIFPLNFVAYCWWASTNTAEKVNHDIISKVHQGWLPYTGGITKILPYLAPKQSEELRKFHNRDS